MNIQHGHRRYRVGPPEQENDNAQPQPPEPEGPNGSFLPAPNGMFQCPNGHEALVAVHIQNIEEKINGTYCMVCWMQFVAQHTPRVRLVRFED